MTPANTRQQDAGPAGLAPAAELEQAEQEVEEVLERIKDGDRKVGPQDLEAAERRVRFARARLEGEERRQQEEAERARQERLAQLGERAAAELDPEPVRRLKEKAQKAMDAYIAACVAHNATLEEIAGELTLLEPLPGGWAVHDSSSGRTISTGPRGRYVRRMRPMAEAADIARTAYRASVPYGFIDLERPLD